MEVGRRPQHPDVTDQREQWLVTAQEREHDDVQDRIAAQTRGAGGERAHDDEPRRSPVSAHGEHGAGDGPEQSHEQDVRVGNGGQRAEIELADLPRGRTVQAQVERFHRDKCNSEPGSGPEQPRMRLQDCRIAGLQKGKETNVPSRLSFRQSRHPAILQLSELLEEREPGIGGETRRFGQT
jgi:hypothetical protein